MAYYSIEEYHFQLFLVGIHKIKNFKKNIEKVLTNERYCGIL